MYIEFYLIVFSFAALKAKRCLGVFTTERYLRYLEPWRITIIWNIFFQIHACLIPIWNNLNKTWNHPSTQLYVWLPPHCAHGSGSRGSWKLLNLNTGTLGALQTVPQICPFEMTHATHGGKIESGGWSHLRRATGAVASGESQMRNLPGDSDDFRHRWWIFLEDETVAASIRYALVNWHIAVESGHLKLVFPLDMAIFHSHVRLPEVLGDKRSSEVGVAFVALWCFLLAQARLDTLVSYGFTRSVGCILIKDLCNHISALPRITKAIFIYTKVISLPACILWMRRVDTICVDVYLNHDDMYMHVHICIIHVYDCICIYIYIYAHTHIETSPSSPPSPPSSSPSPSQP